MRIGLYARVSTSDQNCEMQLRELRDYAAARKWTVYSEYVDTGWSGSKSQSAGVESAHGRRSQAALRCRVRLEAGPVGQIGRRFDQEHPGADLARRALRRGHPQHRHGESNPMARFLLHI